MSGTPFWCCGPVTSSAEASGMFVIKFYFKKVEVDGGLYTASHLQMHFGLIFNHYRPSIHAVTNFKHNFTNKICFYYSILITQKNNVSSVHERRPRGTGGTVPPKFEVGDGPCIRPPNILRSSSSVRMREKV